MREPLPPPLPPETRTVGQLVAESIRLYGRRFWPSLALGLGPALLDAVAVNLSASANILFVPLAGALLLTACYVGASLIASGARAERRALVVAFALGAAIFLPFPFLAALLVLPGVAWLALVGLAVPVAVIERLGPRAALARGFQLARADYVHALGSLATLAITVFLTRTVLVFLLRDFGEATIQIAVFLADVVISPLLFLGSALLYFDQAARVVGSGATKRRRRRRDAHLHHAEQPDGAGRTDAEGEPRAAARGQP